jgi:hypothetical protein
VRICAGGARQLASLPRLEVRIEEMFGSDYSRPKDEWASRGRRCRGQKEQGRPTTTEVVRWTGAEKKVARRAFDAALECHLSAIIAEAKRMMADVADPSDLWEVEAYLTDSRKTVDRIEFTNSDIRTSSEYSRFSCVTSGSRRRIWLVCDQRKSPTLRTARSVFVECSATRSAGTFTIPATLND